MELTKAEENLIISIRNNKPAGVVLNYEKNLTYSIIPKKSIEFLRWIKYNLPFGEGLLVTHKGQPTNLKNYHTTKIFE